MVFQKGHTQSKGNKGGGRKTEADESVRNTVIDKSWNRINKKFDKKKKTDTDNKKLDDIAIEVAKKTIPKEIKADVNINISKVLDDII